jgi:DNA-binding NarL/FixJ family response regulator
MKVLVVDDHPLVRKGIISTLAFEKEIEQAFEASSVKEAISLLTKESPDITVIDLYLGKEDGMEVVNQAKARNLHTRFVVLTSSSRKEDFDRAQKADVDGYILKEAFTDEFMYAIKVINRGKKFYDSTIMDYRMRYEKYESLAELTEREWEVLRELGLGHSNGQIAKTLYISENTVKKHVSSILSKLGMSHRTEAALYASRELRVGV